MRLYLASTSPRRRELLARAGIAFECVPPGPEPTGSGEPSALAVLRARDKCMQADVAAEAAPGLVLGVDTVVDLDGRELAKPTGRDDARRMLLQLGGREHRVHTAHCLRWHRAAGHGAPGVAIREQMATARVLFRSLDFETIDAYLDTGEWTDKAGAYGIQGHAGRFCSVVEGQLDTVIGLSIRSVRDLMHDLMQA